MNYIYDVLINFDSMIYDHFEWNINDNIYHIKKVPLFKVDEKTINDIKNYNIVVSEDFLNKIKNKTEIYLNRGSKQIEYACILCNGEKVLAVKIDSNGKITRYSKMLISEEIEAIETAELINFTNISYTKGNKKSQLLLKTKQELKKTEYLKEKLKNSSEEQLKYIYYELYNEELKSDDIREKLEKEIKNTWNENTTKMYEFFMLMKSIK